MRRTRMLEKKSMNVLFIEGKGNKICISYEKKPQ